jgi:hypothetical protein
MHTKYVYCEVRPRIYHFQVRLQICEKRVLPSSQSVRLSTWENSTPTGRIFMIFDIWVFQKNLSIKKSTFMEIWQ